MTHAYARTRAIRQLTGAIQAVILIGALAEGALLTLLQLPAAASPLWLPLLAGAWALLFPIALLLQVTMG